MNLLLFLATATASSVFFFVLMAAGWTSFHMFIKIVPIKSTSVTALIRRFKKEEVTTYIFRTIFVNVVVIPESLDFFAENGSG